MRVPVETHRLEASDGIRQEALIPSRDSEGANRKRRDIGIWTNPPRRFRLDPISVVYIRQAIKERRPQLPHSRREPVRFQRPDDSSDLCVIVAGDGKLEPKRSEQPSVALHAEGLGLCLEACCFGAIPGSHPSRGQ